MKKPSIGVWVATMILTGCFGFACAWVIQDGQAQNNMSVLAQAQTEIESKFIGEYDETEVQDAAISAMVEALGDRWSYYLPAEDYQSYEDSVNNAFVGIGVTVQWDTEQNGLTVQEVYEDSPASEVGIVAGDCIVGANGTSFEGLTASEAKAQVSGEEGTQVELTVQDEEGSTRTVQVTRREVKINPVSYQMLDDNVGYIKIDNFDAGASEQSIAAVEALIEEGAQSLVFDVRNNPGGLLTELLKLLDYILPEGPTFITEDYTGQEIVYESEASCVQMPMTVLVNEESYSAAEFFAAALQEADWGDVVGMQTCGKGYSQIPIRLQDGSALVLSTAKYYTAGRVSLIDKGVTPDVTVDLSDEEKTALLRGELEPGQDPQLQAAIEQVQELIS